MEGYSIQAAISSVLLHMLNIVVLFVVLRALVYKPVRKFLKARTDRMQAEREQVEAARGETEKLREQYEAELACARDDAHCALCGQHGFALFFVQPGKEFLAHVVLLRCRYYLIILSTGGNGKK